MKISLLGPVYPYRGGIAHHTARLAQALEEAGHPRQVISFRRQYPSWLYPGRSDREPGRSIQTLDAEPLLDPLWPPTWSLTAERVAAWQPDLAILQWWVPYWALPFASIARRLRQLQTPAAYLVHNAFPHERHPLDAQLARLALGQTDRFLVHSEGQRRALQKLLPGAKKIECIPHPDYDFLNALRRPQHEAAARLGLPAGRPLLLFFGKVRPYKGLHLLIEALARLKTASPRPYLVVAGEFWQKLAEYEKQIRRLGLEDCVRLDDGYMPMEQAADYLSAADLLAAPYLHGSQSGAVHLALGFGLPALAAECIIDPLEAANPALRTFATGDAGALARALAAWLRNPIAAPPASRRAAQGWDELVRALERLAGR